MHSKSGECAKTELDLFSVLPTQVSWEKGLWIDHQPVSSVSDGGPITYYTFVSGHRRLRRFGKDHYGGSRKSDKSKREQPRSE